MKGSAQSEPNYLKVTSKDKDHPLNDIYTVLREHSELINKSNSSAKIEPRVFGFFSDKFRTVDWVVLQFFPYSADFGVAKKDTAYGTKKEALAAAVKYLDNKGYKAILFDLEGMVNKIKGSNQK
jgi:hypothetical protein